MIVAFFCDFSADFAIKKMKNYLTTITNDAQDTMIKNYKKFSQFPVNVANWLMGIFTFRTPAIPPYTSPVGVVMWISPNCLSIIQPMSTLRTCVYVLDSLTYSSVSSTHPSKMAFSSFPELYSSAV